MCLIVLCKQPSSSVCKNVVRSRRSAAERITGVLWLKWAEALANFMYNFRVILYVFVADVG